MGFSALPLNSPLLQHFVGTPLHITQPTLPIGPGRPRKVTPLPSQVSSDTAAQAMASQAPVPAALQATVTDKSQILLPPKPSQQQQQYCSFCVPDGVCRPGVKCVRCPCIYCPAHGICIECGAHLCIACLIDGHFCHSRQFKAVPVSVIQPSDTAAQAMAPQASVLVAPPAAGIGRSQNLQQL